MQSATTRMRWFLRFMPSSRDPLAFHLISQLLLRRRDPFVRSADISPDRGITLKGKPNQFVQTFLVPPSQAFLCKGGSPLTQGNPKVHFFDKMRAAFPNSGEDGPFGDTISFDWSLRSPHIADGRTAFPRRTGRRSRGSGSGIARSRTPPHGFCNH